jgi:hypothetical protein
MGVHRQCQKRPSPQMTRAAAIRVCTGAVAAALGSLFAPAGRAARLGGRNATASRPPVDMSAYMELFERHAEIRRTVTKIPGGVRTETESDAPELVAQLQAHVASMYRNLDRGREMSCMSASLPLLFRHASRYRRQLTLTAKGVAVTETSRDPNVVKAIREHAREVSGFVRDGMAAMMTGGMGGRG